MVDDASEYGKGLADSVTKELGALMVKDAQIDPKAADYSAAVTAMTSADVDTVFYGGYYAEAAKLVSQLRDAGFEGAFVSGDGSLDTGFVEGAGEAAEGAYLTATGAPPDVNPEFQAAFKAKYGTDPALYSPEAYDCARVFLAGDRRRQRRPGHARGVRHGLRRAGHHQADQVRCHWRAGRQRGVLHGGRGRQARLQGPDPGLSQAPANVIRGRNRIVGSGPFHTCRPRRWEAA